MAYFHAGVPKWLSEISDPEPGQRAVGPDGAQYRYVAMVKGKTMGLSYGIGLQSLVGHTVVFDLVPDPAPQPEQVDPEPPRNCANCFYEYLTDRGLCSGCSAGSHWQPAQPDPEPVEPIVPNPYPEKSSHERVADFLDGLPFVSGQRLRVFRGSRVATATYKMAPPDSVRNALKAYGFRWNRVKRQWRYKF